MTPHFLCIIIFFMESGEVGKPMRHFIRTRIVVLFTVLMTLIFFSGCKGKNEYSYFSEINGSVYDVSSGEQLPDASVVLTPGSRAVRTDQSGSYIFEDLDPGQYTVTVQKEGYYVDRRSVEAISGESVRVDVPLRKIQ